MSRVVWVARCLSGRPYWQRIGVAEEDGDGHMSFTLSEGIGLSAGDRIEFRKEERIEK